MIKSAKDILAEHINKCSCDEMYVSRGLIDPTCIWCNYSDDIVIAMDEYVNQSKTVWPNENDLEKAEMENNGCKFVKVPKFMNSKIMVDGIDHDPNCSCGAWQGCIDYLKTLNKKQ